MDNKAKKTISYTRAKDILTDTLNRIEPVLGVMECDEDYPQDITEQLKFFVDICHTEIMNGSNDGKISKELDEALWDNGFYAIANGSVIVQQPSEIEELLLTMKDIVTVVGNGISNIVSKKRPSTIPTCDC